MPSIVVWLLVILICLANDGTVKDV
jgi:hypothetical protein